MSAQTRAAGRGGKQTRHRKDAGRKSLLTVEQILSWAEAYRPRTGQWPTRTSGVVADTTWLGVDGALKRGFRGLPGGSSLARLLADRKGASRKFKGLLSVEQILAWAEAYHLRTGQWPRRTSGVVGETAHTTWLAVDNALKRGLRGLPAGSSLARLLAERKGVTPKPPLSAEQILSWAEAYHLRTGQWPTQESGTVAETVNTTWRGVDSALRHGFRGLPGGSSIARLLADRKGSGRKSPLPVEQILAWADAYHLRTGQWPTRLSGAVAENADTTWMGVHVALKDGHRGLPGGSSLTRLLAEKRGVPNPAVRPRLSERKILGWARAHHAATGTWPTTKLGPVREAPGETWSAVDQALRERTRGITRSSSLARLLEKHCGVKNILGQPRLSIKEILAWAKAHHARTGKWPTGYSGRIRGTKHEEWSRINAALSLGLRGLPGGTSLARLLAKRLGVGRFGKPKLTNKKIVAWADAWYKVHGKRPTVWSGAIPQSGGETWQAVDAALRLGIRGLPGGLSLSRLLRQYPRFVPPSRTRGRP